MSIRANLEGFTASYNGEPVIILSIKRLGSLSTAAKLDLVFHVGCIIPLFKSIFSRPSKIVDCASVQRAYSVLGQKKSVTQ